mmetsp:Transcript_38817/g.93832  ORF Transcript_38817/g.93832 Transcript_38817/m.93832 type:complete len:106 (-) Transcript_38817:796-1113(-)
MVDDLASAIVEASANMQEQEQNVPIKAYATCNVKVINRTFDLRSVVGKPWARNGLETFFHVLNSAQDRDLKPMKGDYAKNLIEYVNDVHAKVEHPIVLCALFQDA